MLTESEKIALLKSGDSFAFESFVKEFQTKVYNTCLGIVQNTEDAEDLSQEVFILIYRSIKRFKGESSLSTWVYRVTVTTALDFLRRKKRKKRFAFLQSLFTNQGEEMKLPVSDFYHPRVRLENKERAVILFKAIDQLSENQKTAFILHKLEDLSYAEIAGVMNISLSSVESLMFRAKQKLQGLLKNYYEENEK
ncbi:RNA polymerase subunit sigma-70 [Sphingobacteriaceae bacterium]|nr:RNA polymerase subunit sigma-70 [Sphingobacteriaceae bacterium]